MQSVIDFLLAHQVVLAALIVGILDLVIALVPTVESNGIFHMIYLFFKGKKTPPTP